MQVRAGEGPGGRRYPPQRSTGHQLGPFRGEGEAGLLAGEPTSTGEVREERQSEEHTTVHAGVATVADAVSWLTIAKVSLQRPVSGRQWQ